MEQDTIVMGIKLGIGSLLSYLSYRVIKYGYHQYSEASFRKAEILRMYEKQQNHPLKNSILTQWKEGNEKQKFVYIDNIKPHYNIKDFCILANEGNESHSSFLTDVYGRKFKSVRVEKTFGSQAVYEIECHMNPCHISKDIVFDKKKKDMKIQEIGQKQFVFNRKMNLAIVGLMFKMDNKFVIKAKFIGKDINSILDYFSSFLWKNGFLIFLGALGLFLSSFYLIFKPIWDNRRRVR